MGHLRLVGLDKQQVPHRASSPIRNDKGFLVILGAALKRSLPNAVCVLSEWPHDWGRALPGRGASKFLEGRVRGIRCLAKEARPFDSAQGRLWGALRFWWHRQTAGSSPGFQPGSE
jgi:hypothetical protein